MRTQAWFMLIVCLFSLVSCQSKAKEKNKTLGIIMFSYDSPRIPNINPHALKDLNKWQINPANKDFTGKMNPIY